MEKFHINDKGEAGKCGATKGGCPFGDDLQHFTSLEAARAANEKKLAEANGWTPKTKPAPMSEADKLMERLEALENHPARSHYGLPEDEQDRYNIEKSIETLRGQLRLLIPYSDFAYAKKAISNEDRQYGVEQTAIRLANTNKTYGWEAIMGDVRRTAKATATYERARNNMASQEPSAQEDIEKMTLKHRDQKVFERVFDDGHVLPQEYEQAFQDRWNDPKVGEKYFVQELNNLIKLKSDYDAGAISPTKIIGGGMRNPKAVAEAYLSKREYDLKRAIETKGRSDYVTVFAVVHQAQSNGWPLAS